MSIVKLHLLVIDGNSIMHAAHNSTPLSVGGFEVQAIFGMLRSLKSLQEATPGKTSLLVLWDGRAQFRYDLLPEYKGKRKATDAKQAASKASFKAQAPFVELALKYLGVRQMRYPHLEADDLAGVVVRSSPGRQITLVSGDRDWIGLVNETTSWFDPIRDRRVDFTNFFEKTGYISPLAYYQGKALQGDGSDNVPGVGGIGETGAPLFLAQWGTVESFFKQVAAGTTGKLGAAHTRFATPEGHALFQRNMQLMNLLDCPRIKAAELAITHQPADPVKFESLCNRFAFASITRQMPQYLQAFGITPEPAVTTALV